jgi:hypothetical protein
VAAGDPVMFCGFYFVNNHKIANNSTIAEAREKNKRKLEILKKWWLDMNP